MIRRFCDGCNTEIEKSANRDTWTLKLWQEDSKQVDIKVECMVTINGTTNGGDICRDCIVRTVATGEVKSAILR